MLILSIALLIARPASAAPTWRACAARLFAPSVAQGELIQALPMIDPAVLREFRWQARRGSEVITFLGQPRDAAVNTLISLAFERPAYQIKAPTSPDALMRLTLHLPPTTDRELYVELLKVRCRAWTEARRDDLRAGVRWDGGNLTLVMPVDAGGRPGRRFETDLVSELIQLIRTEGSLIGAVIQMATLPPRAYLEP